MTLQTHRARFPRPWTDKEIFVKNMSAPIRDVMRFTLVYHGPLPASANKAKTAEVARIRVELSKQLQYLWKTHPALSALADYGFDIDPEQKLQMFHAPEPSRLKHIYRSNPQKIVRLIDPIRVGEKNYHPLVRKSLHLNCELKILFLRQDDPGSLITQGGDLDGRVKTLFDALRMPSEQEQSIAPPFSDEIYCLMESDTLVAAVDVDTDRLLFPETEYPNEVHAVIEVSLRVLRVEPYNTCLL